MDKCVKVPCNIGDIAYVNFSIRGSYLREKDRPYPVKIIFIGLNDSVEMGGGYVNFEYVQGGHQFQLNFSDFGLEIFTSKEEAEDAML